MQPRKLFTLLAVCAALSVVIFGQQLPDPTFDASVARPAYKKSHPKVLFDEAHNNFHTATGRYQPFAALITNDGYVITSNKEKFQKKILEGYDVLVIANALGAERQNLPEASQPAFTPEECDAVRDWVRSGGSLLLIADHAPFGAAADIMAQRFEVDMSKGHTSDPAQHDSETGNMSFLLFTRANKLLSNHPIMEGRDQGERINTVISFTGQSLKGPPGSTAILQLSETAMDVIRTTGEQTTTAPSLDRLPDGRPIPPGVTVRAGAGATRVSAAGRAQAVAFKFGKGRVVVLGEAAMISAQVVKGPAAQLLGAEEFRMGMNRKGIDNRQLALNIMHWLSKLL